MIGIPCITLLAVPSFLSCSSFLVALITNLSTRVDGDPAPTFLLWIDLNDRAEVQALVVVALDTGQVGESEGFGGGATCREGRGELR